MSENAELITRWRSRGQWVGQNSEDGGFEPDREWQKAADALAEAERKIEAALTDLRMVCEQRDKALWKIEELTRDLDYAKVCSAAIADRDGWVSRAEKAEQSAREAAASEAALREALNGLIAEFDQLMRHGSPFAKAANPRIAAARAALSTPPSAAAARVERMEKVAALAKRMGYITGPDRYAGYGLTKAFIVNGDVAKEWNEALAALESALDQSPAQEATEAPPKP